MRGVEVDVGARIPQAEGGVRLGGAFTYKTKQNKICHSEDILGRPARRRETGLKDLKARGKLSPSRWDSGTWSPESGRRSRSGLQYGETVARASAKARQATGSESWVF